MEVDLSGTVLAFQGTLDCAVVQNVRVCVCLYMAGHEGKAQKHWPGM